MIYLLEFMVHLLPCDPLAFLSAYLCRENQSLSILPFGGFEFMIMIYLTLEGLSLGSAKTFHSTEWNSFCKTI